MSLRAKRGISFATLRMTSREWFFSSQLKTIFMSPELKGGDGFWIVLAREGVYDAL
jgi:hypothetical protein